MNLKNTNHFELDSRKEGVIDPFNRLRLQLGPIIKRIKSVHIADWANKVISVAEPAGRVTMSRQMVHASGGDFTGITVLSANLWHDWPRFRNIEKRLEAFARLVEHEKADLIMLQEIARTQTFKVDTWLADRLGMSYVYSRSNGSEIIGFEEGLGVFSRFPLIRKPYIRQVSGIANPIVRRMALGVEVETPCGRILAFSVHLGLLRKQNAHQLEELHRWISRLSGNRSVVIGGDFNVPEKSHQIRRVRTFWQDTYRLAQAQGHSHTHTVKWPWGDTLFNQRIDYIFLQPGLPALNVMDVRHLDPLGDLHSDHRAVIARLAPIPAPV
jgi:endonuclease/exonuclease/phosphatase family metal-dependent hydrolase